MLAVTDYVGLGSLIAATCAGLVSIIVACRQGGTIAKVDDVHAAVTTSNGATLAGVVEKIDRATAPAETPPTA